MTADCNGWADMPEDQREALDICNRPSGYRILASLNRIFLSREMIRTSRVRVNRGT